MKKKMNKAIQQRTIESHKYEHAMALNHAVKHFSFIFTVILISAFSAYAFAEEKQTTDVKALVSNIIRAYGGAKTIEDLKTVYAKGRINALMRGDEGSYVRHFERNRKLRVETLYSRSAETRILNGKKGWRSTDRGPLPEVTDYRYLAMVYQYKQLDLPYGLLKKTYLIKSTGTESLNSRDVHVLELFDGEGPPLKAFIDPDSFYVVKVTGLFRIEDTMTTLSAEFSDFRIINGMPFPYKTTNYASGHKVGETVIEEYSVNSNIDPSLFKP